MQGLKTLMLMSRSLHGLPHDKNKLGEIRVWKVHCLHVGRGMYVLRNTMMKASFPSVLFFFDHRTLNAANIRFNCGDDFDQMLMPSALVHHPKWSVRITQALVCPVVHSQLQVVAQS